MSIYGDLLGDDDDETGGAGLPDPVDTVAGPSTKNQAVFDRIQQVRQGTGGDAGSDPSTPSTPFSANDLAAMDYAHGAQQDASIGRALNAVASGFGAKVDNSGYDAQVNNANTTANKVMDRSARVAQAVAARSLKDQQMAAAKTMFDRKQAAVEAKNKIDADKAAAEIDKAKAEAAKIKGETITPPADGATTDPNADPAILARHMVPKEQQEKVFKEIERAENIKKMRQTILDAFDQAASDTDGLGRIGSMIRTPRSVNALHGNLMTTLQDVEGSVREAAAQSLKDNFTPKGSDTSDDKATRRQALSDYLDSKMSAPIARGNGIDLTKFSRTSSPPEVKDDGDDESGGGKDSKISDWANQHGLSYAQAEAIIAKRRANAGGS